MAFESLSDKFSAIFKKIRGQARLTEANMDAMLKEIRVALLEADVNFKVVKAFVEDVKEKAIGQDVYAKVNPSQMVVKIVHDEIESLLGDENCALTLNKGLTTIMLVGLQGTGKTTTAGKLAYLFHNKQNKKVLVAALDIYRPGAIEQLEKVVSDAGADFFSLGNKVNPVEIAKKAKAKEIGPSVAYHVFELFDGARTINIQSGDKHLLVLLVMEQIGKFTSGRGFTSALQTNQHNGG